MADYQPRAGQVQRRRRGRKSGPGRARELRASGSETNCRVRVPLTTKQEAVLARLRAAANLSKSNVWRAGLCGPGPIKHWWPKGSRRVVRRLIDLPPKPRKRANRRTDYAQRRQLSANAIWRALRQGGHSSCSTASPAARRRFTTRVEEVIKQGKPCPRSRDQPDPQTSVSGVAAAVVLHYLGSRRGSHWRRGKRKVLAGHAAVRPCATLVSS